MITKRAVFLSPMVSRASSSYYMRARSSFISKGASLAPQLTRIDFAVFPGATVYMASGNDAGGSPWISNPNYAGDPAGADLWDVTENSPTKFLYIKVVSVNGVARYYEIEVVYEGVLDELGIDWHTLVD